MNLFEIYLIWFGKNSDRENFFSILAFLFRPIITLNWSQIVLHSNNVFEFSTIEPLRKQLNEQDLQINNVKEQDNTGKFTEKFVFI